MVRDEYTDRSGRIALTAGGADYTARRLSRKIGAFPMGIWTDRSKRTPSSPDYARVDCSQIFVTQTPFVEGARLEIADHDVGRFGELLENVGPLFVS